MEPPRPWPAPKPGQELPPLTLPEAAPKLRTWHFEVAFVAVVLGAVLALTAAPWRELFCAAAVLASFGHAQVSDRLAEHQASLVSAPVSCFRWSARYFVAKELLWVAYFVATGAYAALVGCGVFLAYPVWRRYWRGRRLRVVVVGAEQTPLWPALAAPWVLIALAFLFAWIVGKH